MNEIHCLLAHPPVTVYLRPVKEAVDLRFLGCELLVGLPHILLGLVLHIEFLPNPLYGGEQGFVLATVVRVRLSHFLFAYRHLSGVRRHLMLGCTC